MNTYIMKRKKKKTSLAGIEPFHFSANFVLKTNG